jgi:hypothetical protein
MILHSFKMGDVDDPYLYAGFPISEWQQTEMGQWVMEHVTEPPVFIIEPDIHSMGHRVVITGKLTAQAETYFTLKYK